MTLSAYVTSMNVSTSASFKMYDMGFLSPFVIKTINNPNRRQTPTSPTIFHNVSLRLLSSADLMIVFHVGILYKYSCRRRHLNLSLVCSRFLINATLVPECRRHINYYIICTHLFRFIIYTLFHICRALKHSRFYANVCSISFVRSVNVLRSEIYV